MTYKSNEVIYKYSLKSKIGGGNFGEVWTATDVTLNAQVAVKLLDKSQYSIDERLLEAKIGNRMQHSNVVTINGADVISKDGNTIVAISMPYYPKGSVLSLLNSMNFLELKKSIKCLIDILRGLEYLHENGYFHCDIKPNNILVGESLEYLLTDYGITCHSPNLEAVCPKQSYLPHISPETISSNLYDARTDIYQLGLTAFRLINGISEIRDEFDKNPDCYNEKVIRGKIITAQKFKPYVPHVIRRIITKATAKNPNDRYQSALEMRRALERVKLTGDCTSNLNGDLNLTRNGYVYRYEVITKSKNNYSIKAYKRNIKSNNETRFSKYCMSGLTEHKLSKVIQSFCLEIII